MRKILVALLIPGGIFLVLANELAQLMKPGHQN